MDKEQLNIAEQIRLEAQRKFDILKQEESLQNRVNKLLEAQLANTEGIDNTFTRLMKKKLQEVEANENQTIAEQQLKIIEEKREEIIKRLVAQGKELKSDLLDILEEQEAIIRNGQKRIELNENLNELTDEYKDSIKDSLGLNSQLVKTFASGGILAVGLMFAAKAVESIVGYLKDSVGNAIEMQKTMGVGASNILKFEANLAKAKFSMDGLLYSMDELRTASLAVTEATGNIIVPPETITEVAELNSLLSDPQIAVSLQRTLKNTGVDVGDLTDNIKEMASEMGGNAADAMEFLAENQLELGGMTEEQIMLRAEEALTLKKMGADMKELNRLAGEALDIETSLKNEMKLRMMTGKEINLNELRAAQASGDAVEIGQAQAKLVSQLGDDLHNNLQVQRMISDATGMSREQLLNYNNASKESKKEQEELLAIKEKHGLADLEQAKQFKLNAAVNEADMKNMLIMTGVVVGGLAGISVLIKVSSLLMGKLLKKLPGGDDPKNNPIANFIKGLGTKEVLMGAATMLVVSASLLVTAKALNEFNTVEWKSLGKAGLALLGLVASVAALGAIMMSGVGAVAILAGAAALLTISVSLLAVGGAMKLIDSSMGGMTELVPMLSSLILLTPGLVALSVGVTTLSASLLALSVGLAAVGVFLPVLGALSSVGIFGGGVDDTDTSDSGMGDLLNEVKGLRQDIQSQPIMINVDGRVVSKITRLQKQQNSVSTTGYGG